jgi:hypothetical protein
MNRPKDRINVLVIWSLALAILHAFTLSWLRFEPDALLELLGLIPEASDVAGYGLSAFALELDESAGLELARLLFAVEAPVGLIHLCWLSPVIGLGSIFVRHRFFGRVAAIALNGVLALGLVGRYLMPMDVTGAQVVFGSGMLYAGLEHGVLAWALVRSMMRGGRKRAARV